MPMPAAVPSLSSVGIAFAIVSRNGSDRDQQEQDAGPENNSQRGLPPNFLRQDDCEGKEGIDAIPGATANGSFAYRPINSVITKQTNTVAVSTPLKAMRFPALKGSKDSRQRCRPS